MGFSLRNLLEEGIDRVQGAGRAVKQGASSVVEGINPWDDESRGRSVVRRTEDFYGATPRLKDTFRREHPVLKSGRLNGSGLSSGSASGVNYVGSRRHGIETNSRSTRTMLHEGLHGTMEEGDEQSAYQNFQRFEGGYNDALRQNPDLSSWLANRMRSYREFKPISGGQVKFEDGSADFQKLLMPRLSDLPYSMQNEVHSYVPEYYERTRRDMPDSLNSYYGQYYNPRAAIEKYRVHDEVKRMLRGRL